MTNAQCDQIIDLYLQCKIVKEAWIDQAPINQRNGSTFKELEDLKEMADDLYEANIPEATIFSVLRESLPPTIYHKVWGK